MDIEKKLERDEFNYQRGLRDGFYKGVESVLGMGDGFMKEQKEMRSICWSCHTKLQLEKTNA